MKRHSFDQSEILKAGHSKSEQDRLWSRFQSICSELGVQCRVTGGNFITHEVDCSEDDFRALIELI